MKKLMALGVLLMTVSLVYGQSFTPNREKFVKEFQKSLSEYGKGDYQKFSKNEFPQLLIESGAFPEDYFSKMVETCNLLVEKRMKPYPDIYNYVYSVSSLVKAKQSKESFEAWHSSVDKLLGSRNVKRFVEFIDFSAGFFSESKIATAPNFKWYYLGGEYEFVFDKKAYVQFKGGNLVCRVPSKRAKDNGAILDSLNLIDAEGTYDPVLKKWEGRGGKITWEKVGLDPNKNYAEVKGYELSMKKSTLRVDTVELTTKYFDQPIIGSLTERAFRINREEDKVFPQFLSFDKRLLIKDIVKDMDYIGGFTLKGASFVGEGTNNIKAQLTYFKDGAPFMKVRSSLVQVLEDKVRVNSGGFTMYLHSGDSITHPGINFLYDLEGKNIQLTRTGNGIGQASFQDSYHQLEIYVPKIMWEVGSDNLQLTYEFGTSQEQKVASLESMNYFDEELYDRLQGMASVHPLLAIWNYCYKYDEYVINEGKAATALHLTVEQAKNTLLKLSNMGFINYDTENKMVSLNPKLKNFVRAKAGKQDYDNIVFNCDFRPKSLKGFTDEQIQSDPYLKSIHEMYEKQNEERRIKKNFGVLNLTTLDLDLEAIDQVMISQARNTMVFPDMSAVKVKKNRDFNFSGWVNAGKLEIDTKGAKFNYEKNLIKLLSTDEALFRVRPLRIEDGMKSIPMISSLNGISGEILVDDVENRSGKKPDFDDYPKLISANPSKIFYNSKDIYHGVYDSTRFYYTVEPFTRDSLNTFNEKNFRLEGELTSAGIFPKIKEPVKIMPDYSFGFSTMAPEGGYQFYGTEAKYDNKIVLSHNGLQGSGTINFVHSTSISKALSFLPDSTIGVAQFENRPVESGVQFPDVKAEQAYITYIPKSNKLKAQSLPKQEMIFFDGEAKMRGTAIVRPKGMVGKGLMTFVNATVISDNFRYKRYDIDADTSGFNLKNESPEAEEDPLAFKTDNVNAHISFKDRKGVFKSNEGESVVDFPVNQYRCKMDQFTWLMDELSIEMQKKEEREVSINTGVDLVGPNFFSTHPKQDSLQFRAPKAKFDLKEKTIYCREVEYLDVADARIYPDSMKLNIRKKAKMDKLLNAKIVANYITKYHTFTEAEVEVKARRDYSAIGQYPYYDADSNVTYISMKEIGLDTAYQTKANGAITEDAKFKLSNEFDYYGDVAIQASSPLITFEGATRINHNCDKFDRNWMAFTSAIDPKNIQIPVSNQMKDLDGGPISAGIVWRDSRARDSVKLYPTFLSSLYSADDPIVMTSSGFLQYNDQSKEFQIASKEKLLNRGEKGNYIALHTESCSMNGDGNIALGMNFGDVETASVGVVNYNQATGETTMNITTKFTMALDKGLMQGIADRINAVEGLKAMDFSSTTLEQAVMEWEDVKASDKMKDEYIRLGELKKVPNTLEKSITISGLRLSSYDNSENQSKGLITNVKSAVLVNMYGKPVMKYVPFHAFFEQLYSGQGGDQFSLYINIPGGRDYFMHYTMEKKDGLLRIKTGDTEASAAINEMKDDKKKTKNFKYDLTTSTVFLHKFMELFGDE